MRGCLWRPAALCLCIAACVGSRGRSDASAAPLNETRSSNHEGNRVVRPPNIIYVMTDDQGYGDIAAHGNPVVKTPNLDRLHAESVRFTEFHASPTCAPTRAALLTGRHEFRSGVTHTIFERERLALSAVTLPQLLRRGGGYTTGIFGKWHLGDEDEYQPGRRGFDRVFIHGGGGIGQSYPGSCGDAPGNSYFDPVIRSDGRFVKTRGYCTDVFFDAALEWIDHQRQEGRPFFCYLTPNAPHDPLDCPPGSDTPYLAKLAAAGIADPKQRERIAKFYGMVENIDTNMGRLLAKLDEWGLAENTLVVFTTDNGTATGAAVCNDGMRGQKNTIYRGGTRVPSFWRWKGKLPAGTDVPAVTAHIDVLPTLCELAGVAIPPAVAANVEGRSLVPLLRDASAAWPDRPLYTHMGRWDRGQAAESEYRQCRLREGRWSLVNTKNRADSWELYDLAGDPGEKTDVSATHADVVKRLAATYDAWWQSVQPNLVNENLDGPAENPFKTAYRKQFGPPAAASSIESSRRPNIVLFLADDLGYGELGCYGNAAAIQWLQTSRDASQPFFLTVWTHEPHYPIASADRYEKQHAGIMDPEERTYRANITQLDDAFGRLLKALDDIGASDNTLVFFTSDNGPEGGHRVPGIVRWPGRVQPGTESGEPVIGSDLFPTVLAAAMLDRLRALTAEIEAEGPDWWKTEPLNGLRRQPAAAAPAPAG